MKLPTQVAAIVIDVAHERGVTVRDILGRAHTERAWLARREAMQRVRQAVVICGKPPSTIKIGGWFNRDASTVSISLRKQTA
jgi:chromosomal replication initiation ATPase DnaA